MTIRLGLRWKIILLTALAPTTLAVATWFTVDRNVRAHVDASSIHESLAHSAAVFESMLRTRSSALAGGAEIIARDPRFFSLLMLGATQQDSRFVGTVRGMARDFNRITQTDLFEVVDRRGRVIASVGSVSSTSAARTAMVREALAGHPVEGVLVESDAHFQVALTPVYADRRIVGVLLLGARIGSALAGELHDEMLCEVTFMSGDRMTGTTLPDGAPRDALRRTLREQGVMDDAALTRLGVLHVRAPHANFLTLVRHLPGAAPGTGQLYVIQRSFDPETSFQRVMRQDVIALAAMALILAVLTAFAFSDQILHPLQRLVRGAQAIERGDYEQSLDVRTGDELGILADRFDHMRRRERATLESLKQAADLKSKFLSIASHELRTPVSMLTGYRELLAGGDLGALSEPQRQALEKMREPLSRLATMAEETARFARVHSERLILDRQAWALGPILENAIHRARAAGSRRAVTIELDCEPGLPPLSVDSEVFAQAVLQLVTNGIRFTRDGGRVSVVARRVDDHVRIEVRDTGIGMTPERLDALLRGLAVSTEVNHHRSNSSLEFNSAGLGLGFGIARAVIEAHGGSITGTSRPGDGSTFAFVLPLEESRQDRAAA